MLRSKTLAPVQLVAIYATLGLFWLVGVELVERHPAGDDTLSDVARGMSFLLGSSLLIYHLARLMTRRVLAAELARSRSEHMSAGALERANRLYRTLARANEVALAATDNDRLCQDICQAFVDCAGMRLAWIGWVDESSRMVKVHAAAGPAQEYTQGLIVSVEPERVDSRGPTGSAILRSCAIACQDIENETIMRPWRDRARPFGLRSSAAMPVSGPDGRRGAITIYAGEPGFFTPEIVELLTRLAADLMHGLEMIAVRRRMEAQTEALRQSEQRWQFALEGAGEGVWDWKVQTNEIFYSPHLLAMLGYRPDELRPHIDEWAQRVHPDDKTRVDQMLKNYLAGASARYECEHRLRCKDGSYLWILDRGAIVERAADGRPLRMLGTHADITARKRAEHDYATLFETMLEGFALHEMVYDAAGKPVDYRFLRVNPAFERLTGLKAAKIEGHTVREVMPSIEDYWIERYAHVVATGEGAMFEEFTRDLGKQFEVTAFRTEPGRFACIFSDITERKRASERMDLLETALQAVPAGIVVTDATGQVEWVNEGFTRLTGYGFDEVLGHNPRVLKSGRHPVEFYSRLWQTILRGEVWRGELINRRKDGTEYDEHMIIAPVSHGGDGITHFIAIKQDVTEQKKIEQQFLRAQRMEGIGLLAGGIAHDLNNVLAPILLSVELLRMRCKETADRRTLEVIEAAARRGSGVVRQVLTFARGIDGERSPLRPRDLLRELVMMIEETFPRDIDIRREVADDTAMIRGDMTQLHQVLLNLAVNARDAMPEGGLLVFGARNEEVSGRRPSFTGESAPGSYVVLSVRDSGQGMPPEVRERIFEPFFTTKPRGKGTGLGLPTVLGIVRSHGGFIEVDSQPGAGSEFRLYLPAVPPEKTQSTPPMEVPQITGQGRTVLVCDDESAVREVAGIVLKQAGFKVIEAANGREALTEFAAHRAEIRAVLIDIMMPLMTGDRAAAEILHERPDLPVIFMSGLMDHEAVQSALKNVGARIPPLLKKPFTAADLLNMMARVMDPVAESDDAPTAG